MKGILASEALKVIQDNLNNHSERLCKNQNKIQKSFFLSDADGVGPERAEVTVVTVNGDWGPTGTLPKYKNWLHCQKGKMTFLTFVCPSCDASSV